LLLVPITPKKQAKSAMIDAIALEDKPLSELIDIDSFICDQEIKKAF
jgi:hypothetical protein